MQQQVAFLNKRLQFVLSTGSVFRQKVVLLLRQCAAQAATTTAPSASSSLATFEGISAARESAAIRKLYEEVMAEVQQTEDHLRIALTTQQDQLFVPEGAGGVASSSLPTSATVKTSLFGVSSKSVGSSGNSAAQRDRLPEDAESIRKAHHICQILAEKNALKEQEVRLRHDYHSLQAKFDDLNDRHKRLVLAQSGGGGGGFQHSTDAANPTALAFRELYEGRIKELESAIGVLRQENQTLRAAAASSSSRHRSNTTEASAAAAGDREGLGGSPSYRAGSLEPPVDDNNENLSETVQTLTKHNNLLRSRVAKLKEELRVVTQQSSSSVNQLHDGLDSLLGKIAALQDALAEKDQLLAQITEEKRDLAKECVTHRAQVELYVKQLELFVKDTNTTSLTAARQTERTNGDTASLSSAVEDYLAQIHSKEAVIQSLTEQLREEKRAHQERAVEVRALGVQLDTFRGKMEALQAQQQQQHTQRVMMDEVQGRLFGALETIRATHNTSNLAGKIEELSQRIRNTEHVEIQLRLKEDELVLLREDLEHVSTIKDQLQQSLEAISVMFTKLPQNLEDVERCIIERDAYREELEKAYRTHTTPDQPHVLGVIELRLLELQAAAAGNEHTLALQRKLGGRRGLRPKRSNKTNVASHSDGGADEENAEGDEEEEEAPTFLDELDEEAYALHQQLEALMDIPPLPQLHHENFFAEPLAPIAASPIRSTHGADLASSPLPTVAASSSPLPNNNNNGLFSPLKGSGGTAAASDAVMTFQLFDDQGAGVLPVSVLELCLATLGVRKRLPAGVTSMTTEEFVAFCCAP